MQRGHPMFDQGNIVSFNGAQSLESQVRISIHDPGFIYGNAVFDSTLAFKDWPFELRDHPADPRRRQEFKHR